MKIIAGLGNPGLEYAVSRHNCGFLTIDKIAYDLGADREKKEHNSLTRVARMGGSKLLLAKPQTYMNNSGFAVCALLNYYKLKLTDLLIIFDDMDLEPATVRLRRGGSSGGHNGMQSIIEQCGSTDIARIKIGIGHGWGSGASHVLGRFAEEAMPMYAAAFTHAAQAALCWAEHGISEAMNKYNASIEDKDRR